SPTSPPLLSLIIDPAPLAPSPKDTLDTSVAVVGSGEPCRAYCRATAGAPGIPNAGDPLLEKTQTSLSPVKTHSALKTTSPVRSGKKTCDVFPRSSWMKSHFSAVY